MLLIFDVGGPFLSFGAGEVRFVVDLDTMQILVTMLRIVLLISMFLLILMWGFPSEIVLVIVDVAAEMFAFHLLRTSSLASMSLE